MKKILSILGAISLITSGSSNLMACNNNALKTLNTLTSEELAKLKAENSKNINGNKLEGIAPQEKPFKTADDNGYVVIWRISKDYNGNINKFINGQNDNLQGIALL